VWQVERKTHQSRIYLKEGRIIPKGHDEVVFRIVKAQGEKDYGGKEKNILGAP